ncbi:flagellar basal body P-ring biosynthesis protein FlgA [bacterium BMS3Bbin06]|nr:flagellar basal body P-ring biosynthesis protein FlgA [bacterium BMS3Abin08]GBE35147.1 flagellar basal body P-ring biosynthesis protein FlgA [bacterium BMS3Bbin06]HDO36455.1 flagellar basal body P-ring formation protein FlgA [Nitrospirota bacterium]HDY70040.1 flagellar basal body P-ring formation protein FlgA [Nitrospirota bacterium]
MITLVLLSMLTTWSPEKVLVNYLLENYPWPDIQVEAIAPEGDFPGERPVEIITERGPMGRALFIFRFSGDREVRVHARVTARDRVVRTVRSLSRGMTLNRAVLYTTMMDVRKTPRGAVGSVSDLKGKQLKRSLAPDTVVTRAMIKERPLIKKGERVSIVYQSALLKITAPGIAREEGGSGDGIRVLNLASRRMIVGFVTGKGTVNVRP